MILCRVGSRLTPQLQHGACCTARKQEAPTPDLTLTLRPDDIPALGLLLRSHLPSIVLHPNTDSVNNAKGTAMSVSVVNNPNGRCCLRLPSPSYKVVLVVCGLPKSVKKFTFGWGESYFNRSVGSCAPGTL